jgi:DNA polymerase-3 subunit alpha
LAGERDTLGHFLSGHPTDACAEALRQLATCAIGEVDSVWRPPAPGEMRRGRHEIPVTLAGMVAGLRRRGDQMAFVQLEDGTGRIEASFFRDAFVEYGPLLTRDRILVIEGGLSLDEFSGNLVLRARSAMGLDEACERCARGVRVHLNGVDANFVEALKRQLKPFMPGTTPVRLEYRNREASTEIELGDAWRVRASQSLVDALLNLPGALDVKLDLRRASGGN